MELYEWSIDVIAVTETQLRERVDMCCDMHRMIKKGRSKSMRRAAGGFGMPIRNDLRFWIHELYD